MSVTYTPEKLAVVVDEVAEGARGVYDEEVDALHAAAAALRAGAAREAELVRELHALYECRFEPDKMLLLAERFEARRKSKEVTGLVSADVKARERELAEALRGVVDWDTHGVGQFTDDQVDDVWDRARREGRHSVRAVGGFTRCCRRAIGGACDPGREAHATYTGRE